LRCCGRIDRFPAIRSCPGTSTRSQPRKPPAPRCSSFRGAVRMQRCTSTTQQRQLWRATRSADASLSLPRRRSCSGPEKMAAALSHNGVYPAALRFRMADTFPKPHHDTSEVSASRAFYRANGHVEVVAKGARGEAQWASAFSLSPIVSFQPFASAVNDNRSHVCCCER
jgi:hypothetical protein